MAKLITSDGLNTKLSDTSLTTLQKAVGGHIEAVPLGDGRYLVVNEDSLGLELPNNIVATTLLHMAGHHPSSQIVGNAVLCEPGELA